MALGQRAVKSAKERRRLDMIRVAADMFREQGYEATRMEDIAARAGVVPATVYNHFKTKGDLLLAIGLEVASETDARSREYFQDLVEHPVFAVTAYVMLLSRDSLDHLDRATWRHHLGLIMSSSDASIVHANDLFVESIQLGLERLIKAGQSREEIPQEWDARHRAELCYRVFRSRFADLVQNDHLDLDSYESLLMRDYVVLLSSD